MSLEKEPVSASDRTAGLDPSIGAARRIEEGASFGRYRDLRLIGSGGMAAVYEAHDPTLGRSVALKLLRGDDADLAERLLLEARSQASIEHPHVCRIYEAGACEGRPYIAMQFVAGQTLKDLHASLGLEAKLKLMQEVAEAVHAAHRGGLVHRDLKPSNIMVERTPDGRLFPYVMDFGLAREAAAPGFTATGIVLGTPWYMSPEQARGESRSLDRRSDVYSLGATLYELLGRTPPFDGKSSVEVVMKLLSEEPVPLGRRDPGVPRDVETIVMKCLGKEPDRRYDSARALAEDIGRYLDGEPIHARATGFHQRLYMRARKNKALSAVVGVALLLVLAFAAMGLSARASARRQAELAAEFARAVEDVSSSMRVAHMAPLHDVRGEKDRVRQRLARIEERMRTAGNLARGPGEYALGRGHLVLGDPVAAKAHLEGAWAAGYRTPEAAYALGLALGEIYSRELELADAIGARELREAKRREIQAAYRDPAIGYLRQAHGTDAASPEYVDGLLASHERRFGDALAKADAALARAPWLYEAQLLKGEVHALRSRTAQETGDPSASAKANEDAEAAYGAAALIARSEPAALEGLCQVGLQRMEGALWAGVDLAPLHDAAARACGTALLADPDRAEVHAKLANVHRYRANDLLMKGRDPREVLDLAADHAARAALLDAGNRRAAMNLGLVHRLRAQYETAHGLDSSASLRQAFASLERAVELSGADAGSLSDLGNAYLTRAEDPKTREPLADIERAVALYDRALEKVPDFAYAHGNRGTAFLDRARIEVAKGRDAAASVAEALRSLKRTAELLPKAESVYVLMAEARCLGAESRLSAGFDPDAELQAAREDLRAAAVLNPDPAPDVLLVAGQLEIVAARADARAGRSPGKALAAARARLRSALARDPKLGRASALLAEADAVEARSLTLDGGHGGR